MISLSSELDPSIWSRYSGHRVAYFDGCRLTITWMPSIKELNAVNQGDMSAGCMSLSIYTLALAVFPYVVSVFRLKDEDVKREVCKRLRCTRLC